MAGKGGRFDRAAYWPSMIVPIKRGILSIDPGAGKYPIPSIRFPPIVVSLHNLHVSADLSRATDKTAFGEKKQTCKPLKVLGWLAAAPPCPDVFGRSSAVWHRRFSKVESEVIYQGTMLN